MAGSSKIFFLQCAAHERVIRFIRLCRQLAIAGRKGHVATFDWHTGKLGTEVQLKETVRDVCWLHNASFFAAAQKKYVYIYDKDGLEIHQLRNHIEVNRLEFLRHHFLLSSIVSVAIRVTGREYI